MSYLQQIKINMAGREISFAMNLDPDFIADGTLLHYFKRAQVPEPEVVHLLCRVLKEGDTAIDVGANVGFFTLLMSQLVGDTGHVLAVEPGINNISKLEANVIVNNKKNATTIQAAAWSKNEKLDFYLVGDSGSNTLAEPKEYLSCTKVSGIRLDLGRLTPEVLKIDVEGAEAQALQGADRFFINQKPYIVCELNEITLSQLGQSRSILRWMMRSYGYDTFLLHENGEFPTFLPIDIEIKSEKQNLNVLFSTIDNVKKAWPEAVI